MAKAKAKTKPTQSNQKKRALELAVDQIDKQFGEGSIMKLGEGAHIESIASIPTGSISLDAALGIGGIPRGRVSEIFGPEMSGKTTLALHILAEAQKLGGNCVFIDAEHALDPNYAKKLGVNIEELLISQPDSGEQALEICETLVRSGAVDAVVLDSVAALVPQAEIEGDMGDTHVGLQARLMSQALRKLTSTIHRSKTAVIFINQLREKIGVTYGSPEVTPGGRALKFYSSVRIDLRRVESIKQGAEVIGNRVRARVVKNKVAAPFRVAEFDIMFNLGISKMGDILEIGVEQGIIKKSGAFYSYGETKLGQGRENSKEFLIQHPEIAASVEGRLRGPLEKSVPDNQVSPSEASANGNSSNTTDSVSDILSGNTILEPDDNE